MRPFPSVLRWTAFAAGVTIVALAIGSMLHGIEADDWFFVENGPIEMLEALVLVFSLVPLTAAFLKTEGWVSLACIGLAAVVWVMIMRELPRCGGAYSPDNFCIPRHAKNPLYALGPMLAVIAVWRRRPRLEYSVRAMLFGGLWAWPVLLTAAILSGGQAAEKLHYPQVEEMLELGGYVVLIALGCWILRRSTGPGGERWSLRHAAHERES